MVRQKMLKSSSNKGNGIMSQYYRTSITLPVAVAEELQKRRGDETFSGQIGNDLTAYWEAVRSGMVTLRLKFTRSEACFIADALDARNWGSLKLDDMALAELAETVRNEGLANKYDVNPEEVVQKILGLTLLELMSLLNWSRTARQREDSPEKAAAVFLRD